MGSNWGLSRIGQVAVTVRDLDRAVAFYRDTLGMQFLFQVPNMAFFDCSGVRLLLAVPNEPGFDPSSSIIYYKVDDISPTFETLSARGVEFVSQPHLVAPMGDHELWMAFFKDVDGNILALMSEIPVGAHPGQESTA